LFQAVTQINEQTLSFIPKILVIVAALVFFAPWMSDTLTTFTKDLILNIPHIVMER
jgi:flagellar biosynthetic protein FliQ